MIEKYEEYLDCDIDIHGEDDEYEYYETLEQKLEAEIIKIGQPWNKATNILEPGAEEKIKKHGEEAIRLQQIREALQKIKDAKNNTTNPS